MLVEKNLNYEGVFFVGVKMMGIFCCLMCLVKKFLKENCEFFSIVKEVLFVFYWFCKCCELFFNLMKLLLVVKLFVDVIEKNLEKKWMDKDFDELFISVNIVWC